MLEPIPDATKPTTADAVAPTQAADATVEPPAIPQPKKPRPPRAQRPATPAAADPPVGNGVSFTEADALELIPDDPLEGTTVIVRVQGVEHEAIMVSNDGGIVARLKDGKDSEVFVRNGSWRAR